MTSGPTTSSSSSSSSSLAAPTAYMSVRESFGRKPWAQALALLMFGTAGAGLVWLGIQHRRQKRQRGAVDGNSKDEANLVDDDEAPELEDLADAGGFAAAAAGGASSSRGPKIHRRGQQFGDSEVLEDSERRASLPGRQRIHVKSMGCAHNSSDSEFMVGLLQEYGYILTEQLEDADMCLVNSCTVKNPSQDSAMNLVKRARAAGKPVVLSGCVPSADSSVTQGLDGVSVLDVSQIDRIVEVAEEALKGNTVQLLTKRKVLPTLDLPKVRRNSCVEIIPISGGCLGNCSYCKTKHARGKLSSYTEDAIIKRALQAASEGASEIWLASEDTGAYGLDIGSNIAILLNKVADSLPPGVMLKLGMTNPPYMLAHIDAVAEVLKRPNVFEFIHVPVQSGSNHVLQAMVREYTIEDFSRLADGLRALVPDLLLATDIICGFPAESEQDHEESLAMVRKYKFPVLNISQFYPRPGTAAAKMKRLPGHVAKQRSTEVTQAFDSYETNSHLLGREERVWFSDTEVKHGQTVGHTKGYVKVVVPREDSLLGKSKIVKVKATSKWHLEGEVIRD
mmetsp:Transcript_2871/g.6924  ORF Transcript_2871/g.6924 Transcript_2871/m.6924 type:complete len:564 (-) Transcript_2871:56-1747(-)|eukprot:CAMPEP_0206472468 /NCGR_PEP_ID=MMETSP0324_2-20121206/32219_1 /ASSEMBLY_ACC=CAM_ASM_000836 /TAXON_ID=2866 /ORGANISM="Crypthecodinium cohnii, Strain Seligo" /LENGTH=563 /DNA_ID=CAMNT_0053947075 /DNA_START=25 /DNA_END=1716 /DNA_ORIENTATION=+